MEQKYSNHQVVYVREESKRDENEERERGTKREEEEEEEDKRIISRHCCVHIKLENKNLVVCARENVLDILWWQQCQHVCERYNVYPCK